MKRLMKVVLFFSTLIYLVYRFRKWVFAWSLRLTKPTQTVMVEHNIRVPMRDGATLATDHYYPAKDGDYPTILIRSPYGRRAGASAFGHLLTFFAHRFTERGYHVVLQDTRGRFESNGIFDPYRHEKDDGLATLDWIAEQPWYNGVVGLWGGSYLGMVQWAVANHAPQVKAMAPSITGTDLHSILYPDGALDLGLAMRWLALFDQLDIHQDKPFLAQAEILPTVEQQIKTAFMHLPVMEADKVALGKEVDFYRTWLENPNLDDEIWRDALDALQIEEVNAPAHLFGGWYDFFLRPMLQDYKTLRESGHNPYLTIGPWHHFNAMVSFGDIREGLYWFDAHLKGDTSHLRDKPVRIYVMGAQKWRDMDSWPPPSTPTRYYLHAGRALRPTPSDAPVTDHYTYDPADPTPIVGGTQFNPMGGPRDNTRLESRPDVLTYTTEPLTQDVEIIGPVRLQLHVKSSLDHTDFFGRLCDVQPDGRSINICDGLFRVAPGKGTRHPDGSLCIEVDMWATAHRFKAGHQIRLQVSSGAHPRWSRNLGTGEPLATGTGLKVAHQTIYHDQDHPSAVILPVVG